MRYTHFEISNFKGIRHLRLDFDAPPKGSIYTLVGLNESGKTTILEAIDYFTKGNDSLGPKELAGRVRPDEHDLIPISDRANFNGQVLVRAGVELDGTDIRLLKGHLYREHGYRVADVKPRFEVSEVYTFESSKFQKRDITWSLRVTGRTTRGRVDRDLWAGDRAAWHTAATFLTGRMPPIWYFQNFLFDFPRRIYLTEATPEANSNRFYRALLQDILDDLDPTTTVGDHITRRAESGEESDRRALNQLLLEMGRKITDDVFKAWNRIFRRRVDMRVVLSIDRDESRGWYIEFRIEDSDGYFFVHERSLGFRWFFVFLLLTTYRGARKDSSPNLVFLFDEPASNLHSSAQSQLLSSLERLGDACTVIYTTHSQHLINPDWLENTYVVRNKGIEVDADVTEFNARKTNIVLERYRTFASRNPGQSQYFQPILDMLEYAPSKLELVPDMVMLEGKNDFYTLRYMNDVILNLDSDLHFMPGTGAGSLDDVIRLYIGWARNFVVLLDSDKEGGKQKARYIKEFGPIVESRIFTLEELIPELAGKSLESAFENLDRDAIQALVYPGEKYRKSMFFRALQEALATRNTVSFSSRTLDRFTALLNGLKNMLDSLT